MRFVAPDDEQAERLIVEIWLALERRNLPSPTLKIISMCEALLIELDFAHHEQETLVGDALSGYRRLTVV